MSKDQISSNSVVSIEVIDNPDLSFYFDTQSGESSKVKNGVSACKIIVDESSFQKLLDGTSTFEQEVQNGVIKIEGDHQHLRAFGNSLRLKSKDS